MCSSFSHFLVGSPDVSVEKLFSQVHDSLRKRYGSVILPKEDLQWFTLSIGGSLSAMCIVYASFTDYIVFFGTPLGTIGHTGNSPEKIITFGFSFFS